MRVCCDAGPQAYMDALTNVALSGPTLFAPLIQTATGISVAANCCQQRQKYTVLLILTDGAVNDMDATINAIVQGSQQPLSIIIVGLGPADFSGENIYFFISPTIYTVVIVVACSHENS